MQHEELCKEVERQLQFKPKVRTDFDYLSEKIQAKTHETVSANTLMRLWGYRESVNARRSTLDILARFVGSEDYAHFLKERGLADDEETVEPEKPKEEPTDEVIVASEETEVSTGSLSQGSQSSQNIEIPQSNRNTRSTLITPIRAGMLCLLAVVLGFALWHFFLRAPLEEGLPAGAKDMTHLISNPTCDTEELDAWTFEHGGVTLAEDSTQMFYMKNFDVWQVIHGLPAGEYELRVKAWQLLNEWDAALYDYEHAEDKADGCALTTAEIYAGPFSHRVKNRVSMTDETVNDSSDVRLRFVCLDDSMCIGFRSNDNCRRFCRAVADDFRLFLIRKAKSKAELQALSALRDSAQAQAETGQQAKKEGIYLKNHNIVDLWKGQEEPLPEGWTTEQDASLCRLVHKNDVSRGMGDSEIYLEFLSKEPAKPGLLIGQKIRLEPGKYAVGACFFAQNELGSHKNALFAVKGVDGNVETTPMMDYRFVHFELREPQEVTIGLWAPEGSAVRRAGICMPGIWRN